MVKAMCDLLSERTRVQSPAPTSGDSPCLELQLQSIWDLPPALASTDPRTHVHKPTPVHIIFKINKLKRPCWGLTIEKEDYKASGVPTDKQEGGQLKWFRGWGSTGLKTPQCGCSKDKCSRPPCGGVSPQWGSWGGSYPEGPLGVPMNPWNYSKKLCSRILGKRCTLSIQTQGAHGFPPPSWRHALCLSRQVPQARRPSHFSEGKILI